jgi:hypothetical protein
VNRFEWASTKSGRAAGGALAVSAALFLWTFFSAVRVEAVPQLPAPEFASTAALSPPVPTRTTDIEAAVQSDLFATDRTAPSRRYRAPGEESDDAAPAVAPVLPVVLGTAVSDAAHSFATVQLGDGLPAIVRIGDKIGDYTVQEIERERVVFTTKAKKKIDIPELKP